MRTAIFIKDAQLQVVLTPETDEEKAVLNLVEKKERIEFYRGSFFKCQGGWTRFAVASYDQFGSHEERKDDDSLIIVLREPEGEKAEVPA